MKNIITLFLLLVSTIGYSAIYYVSPTGNNTTGDGSTGAPWLTLAHSFTQMSGGDTLILKDGTYTGDNNIVTTAQRPPFGTSSAWTTIKAENDGAAIVDGEGARDPFLISFTEATTAYLKIEGLDMRNSASATCLIFGLRQVKFLKCGASEAGNDNVFNFGAGRANDTAPAGCQYILYENCYGYGSGRYKFIAGGQGTSNIIFRQCVGRLDRVVALTEPCAVFSSYGTTDVLYQNCIALDSDTTSYFQVQQFASGFLVPSTSGNTYRTNYESCISLNNHIGGVQTTSNGSNYAAYYTTYTNCIVWDCLDPNRDQVCLDRGIGTYFKNCTTGRNSFLKESFLNSYDAGMGSDTTIIDSIFTDIHGTDNIAAFRAVESENHNAFWDNDRNIVGAGMNTITPDATDIVNENIMVSTGSLRYLPRIEQNTLLSDKGSTGDAIGANCLKLIGVSGSLWGDTGYNTEQTTGMFPFPYESLIKTKLKAYSYDSGNLSGNRGFCADGKQLNGTDDITLTSYIWEYLGNQMPTDIYGNVPHITFSGVTLRGIH